MGHIRRQLSEWCSTMDNLASKFMNTFIQHTSLCDFIYLALTYRNTAASTQTHQYRSAASVNT